MTLDPKLVFNPTNPEILAPAPQHIYSNGSSLHTLREYCKKGKEHNYPIVNILFNQMLCRNDDVIDKLYRHGIAEGWWTSEDLVDLLEKRKDEFNKDLLREILLYLETLSLDFPLEKRVALIWCKYVKKFNDPDFVLVKMSHILQTHEFEHGFRIMRSKLRLLEPIFDRLTPPAKGDLRTVLLTAMNTDYEVELDRNLLHRMELRWIQKGFGSVDRFNQIIERLDRNDIEAWKLASTAFASGADDKNLNLLLERLKAHGCVDETLVILQYSLDKDYEFNCQYAYWCAEELCARDSFSAMDFVTRLRNGFHFNKEMYVESQIKLYCRFAINDVCKEDAIAWMQAALSFQSPKNWKGLERELVKCAELCSSLNLKVDLSRFLAKLKKAENLPPDLFKRICDLWRITSLGSCQEERIGNLLGNYSFLVPLIEEEGFKKTVFEVVALELRTNPKYPERCFEVLRTYKINQRDFWTQILPHIANSGNNSLQRRTCKAWLELPEEEQLFHWESLSSMVHLCQVPELTLLLEKIQTHKLSINIELIEKLIQSSLPLLKNGNLNNEEKTKLSKALYLVVNCKDANLLAQSDSARFYKKAIIPLLKCLISHETYDNVDSACNLLYVNLEYSLKENLFPLNIYKQLLVQAAHLKINFEDPVLWKLYKMGEQVLELHKNGESLLHTAIYFFNLEADYFRVMSAESLNRCFMRADFHTLKKEELQLLLKDLTLLNDSVVDIHLCKALNNKEKVLSLFKNLPDFLVAFFDRKITETSCSLAQFSTINLYGRNLFSNGKRGNSFENFVNCFLNTYYSVGNKGEMDLILNLFDSIFEGKNYKTKEQQKLFTNLGIDALKICIRRLCASTKDTHNYFKLYTYVVKEVLRQAKSVENSKSYLKIPPYANELFDQFCGSWNMVEEIFFRNHVAAVLVVAHSVARRRDVTSIIFDTINKATQFFLKNHDAKEFPVVLKALKRGFELLKPLTSTEQYCNKLYQLAFSFVPENKELYSQYLADFCGFYKDLQPNEIPKELQKEFAYLEMYLEYDTPKIDSKLFEELFLKLLNHLGQYKTEAALWKMNSLFQKYKNLLTKETLAEALNQIIALKKT